MKARAFTLIEVIVALVLSATLMSVVLGILAATLRDGRRARVHSEMLRDADLVTHLLNSDLRLAGVGVPATTGVNIDVLYGAAPPTSFYGSVIVASTTQVGILGDLPRPDANYGAFGAIHRRPTGDGTAIAWHNENNGSCMPDNNAGTCIVGRDSLFFPDNAAGCNNTGNGAVFSDRKCPWGMRRTLPGDHIIITAGDSNWATATLTGDVQRLAAAAGLPQVYSAELSPGYLVTVMAGGPPPTPTAVWPNNAATDGPGGIAGQGFVATLDRVFFRRVGSTITRRQCWGDPDPNQAGFPSVNVNAVPASPQLVAATGVTPNECTDEEVVARNVSGFAIRTFDVNNAPITLGNPVAGPPDKSDVFRIDYTVDFQKMVDGRNVTHRVQGSVRLTNLLP
jgi:prepilin-type N-terminal cleavage/methylation domain-containing protein